MRHLCGAGSRLSEFGELFTVLIKSRTVIVIRIFAPPQIILIVIDCFVCIQEFLVYGAIQCNCQTDAVNNKIN